MIAAPMPETTSPAAARAEPGAAPRAGVRAVVGHVALNLTGAIAIPTALFYICVLTAGLWPALITALVWCYIVVVWRLTTGRPMSGLLWLTVAGLTGKTLVAFATGSTLIYFMQPALSDAVVAAIFLLSLLTSRPAVARLAGEFYPMARDVEGRPRIKVLFARLTLLWAGICATKAGVTLWLLHSLSTTSFVAAKTVLAPSAAVIGTTVTVVWAVRVARREGLLPATRLTRTAVALP